VGAARPDTEVGVGYRWASRGVETGEGIGRGGADGAPSTRIPCASRVTSHPAYPRRYYSVDQVFRPFRSIGGSVPIPDGFPGWRGTNASPMPTANAIRISSQSRPQAPGAHLSYADSHLPKMQKKTHPRRHALGKIGTALANRRCPPDGSQSRHSVATSGIGRKHVGVRTSGCLVPHSRRTRASITVAATRDGKPKGGSPGTGKLIGPRSPPAKQMGHSQDEGGTDL